VRSLSRRFGGEEKAFTLVEVLVVIVVIGGLAAVAVPAFQGQGSKGTDSEAKSVAVTAAKTIEVCAAEHGGSYESCSEDALVAMEPSLNDAIDRLTVVTGSATYEIGVMSKRDPNVSFTASKAADGTTARTCSTNEDRGGCQALRTGTW
jgi:type IV pilus assembly protein PilA